MIIFFLMDASRLVTVFKLEIGIYAMELELGSRGCGSLVDIVWSGLGEINTYCNMTEQVRPVWITKANEALLVDSLSRVIVKKQAKVGSKRAKMCKYKNITQI